MKSGTGSLLQNAIVAGAVTIAASLSYGNVIPGVTRPDDKNSAHPVAFASTLPGLAEIAFSGQAEADQLKPGASLFTDREFTVSECPAGLEGLPFLRKAIDGVTDFRVEKGGVLTVLTPYSSERRSSQAEALELQGFARSEAPLFQLFGRADYDRVRTYTKDVAAGERYRFTKWVVVLGFAGARPWAPPVWSQNTGELLYNGIRLPEQWPPNDIDVCDRSPMPVPYLDYPPEVVPIDVGRQLFTDGFLIENTDLMRVFHQPEKYAGNPVLWPETEAELRPERLMNAAAVPKDGGVWWDPQDQLFKMWYEAGWIGTLAYATSRDGLNWERPELDVVPGSNHIVPPPPAVVPDSGSVVPAWDSADPAVKWTMYVQPPGGRKAGDVFTSPDGIHWTHRSKTGDTGDRSTHFYNPFRKKWVYSLRTKFPGRGRARDYYETDDVVAGATWAQSDLVAWMMTDELDPVDPETQQPPQLYNQNAVAYESLMLGWFQIHHGPPNHVGAEAGLPKITELMFAYSRDGFHWDRPDRRAHIPAERKDVWDRAYVQSVSGICLVRGDRLWFYYTGFQGNEEKPNLISQMSSGMYDRGSTGVAFLRRDGFASMDAGAAAGTLTTRPVTFSGKQLFVNAAVPAGSLRAEIRDVNGNAIAPFTLANSVPFTGDSTLQSLQWQGASDLSALAGTPVRFHFELANGSLYAFWVSKDESGRSDGYVAAGGPGFTGPTDTVGRAALEAEAGISR